MEDKNAKAAGKILLESIINSNKIHNINTTDLFLVKTVIFSILSVNKPLANYVFNTINCCCTNSVDNEKMKLSKEVMDQWNEVLTKIMFSGADDESGGSNTCGRILN